PSPLTARITKTWWALHATMPGAGADGGNLLQLAAKLSAGMILPNTFRLAEHPQKAWGQPAGLPPITWDAVSRPSGTRWIADRLSLCILTLIERTPARKFG